MSTGNVISQAIHLVDADVPANAALSRFGRRPPPDPGVFMLTIEQFCRRYSVGRTRAFELLKSRAIQRVKVGRSTRILTESADAWARGLAEKGAA